MKPSLLIGLTACSFFNPLNASVYTTNFNSFTSGPLTNQDGWSANDNTDPYSSVIQTNVDIYNPTLVTNALELGNFADVSPPTTVSSVRLSHDYSGYIADTDIGFDFAIRDSVTMSGYLARDQFGISLSNGNTDVFSLLFTPQTQSAGPSAETNAKWNVGYRLGLGSVTTFASFTVQENIRQHLDLSFQQNTGNASLTDVFVSLRTGTVPSAVTIKTITGAVLNPNALVDEFNFLWTKQVSEYGSNQIFVDNLSVIPEPSSSLLLGLAGVCLVSRRRRA